MKSLWEKRQQKRFYEGVVSLYGRSNQEREKGYYEALKDCVDLIDDFIQEEPMEQLLFDIKERIINSEKDL